MLQIFDPPMCCSSGVCGPGVNPILPRFAADLEWLKSQGIPISRYNLAQQPGEFVKQAAVQKALAEQGNACLPLILVDGRIASSGQYPSRSELASMAGLGENSHAG